MKYTSILEKLLFLIQMISTSWIYIAFILVVILSTILLGFKKISKKVCFIINTLATTIIFGYTLYNNYEPISKMVNTLVDNIFLNIYFPSAYAYLFILILINVITIAVLMKPRVEKIYKTINGLCFIITNFTLSLILEVIAKDNIDIFKKESIFANADLITLLEFSVNIFIIWLISLAAIYIINTITERIIISRENKKMALEPTITMMPEITINGEELLNGFQSATEPVITNPVQALTPSLSENKFIPNFTVTTNVVEDPMQNKFIPTLNTNLNTTKETNNYAYNFNDTTTFDLSALVPKKQEIRPISTFNNTNNTNQVFEQILNNELPLIKEEPKPVSFVEKQKNAYTLNDYRIFNNMLKDIREHNGSNAITIDKNLEYRLITKYSTETYNMFKTMLKIYSN